MHDLAILFRAAQFVAHERHQLISGPSFVADHEFLGELYAAYEAAYDATVERMIGLQQPVDPASITLDGATLASQFSSNHDVNVWPSSLQTVELRLRRQIDAALKDKGVSAGTANFLQGLADESEARSYKLLRRSGNNK